MTFEEEREEVRRICEIVSLAMRQAAEDFEYYPDLSEKARKLGKEIERCEQKIVRLVNRLYFPEIGD